MEMEIERKRIKVDAVYDLETEDWTTFVAGGLVYADGDSDQFGVREARKGSPLWEHEQSALAQAILSVEGDVWAHNGGRFDTLWLADRLVKLGIKFQMVCAGSTIVCLKAGKTRVFDSFALTKMKLQDLTDGMRVSKEKLALPCRCGEDCGGYCSIRTHRMTKPHWDRMINYMMQDCRSLMAALNQLQAFADKNDLDLSSTVGGAAWKTAARWLGLPPNDIDPADWKFARDAYFGGRVFVGKRRSNKGWHYDVNSMYPAALTNGKFPSGKLINPGGTWGRQASWHFNDRLPGIYQAIVTIPEMHIPPLPIRAANGRIAYPWGTFRGRWTLPELVYAIELGAEVEIERSLVWSHEESIYGPWARRLFEIRRNAPGGKSSPMGTFVKFLLNAPSGKLGSRAEHDTIYALPDSPTRCLCTCDGSREGRRHCAVRNCKGRCVRGCLGECGAMVPLDKNEIFWRKTTWRIDDCSRPHHAAYLTGLSRIEWHRQATFYKEGRDLVYGDTDSIFVEHPRTRRIGKELGEWNYEGPYSHMICIAPKVYRIEEGGKTHARAKGVSRPKPDMIVPGREGRTLALDTGQQVRGPKSGMRAGQLFERAQATRHISWGTGDRILLPDGINTRAPNISEVELP